MAVVLFWRGAHSQGNPKTSVPCFYAVSEFDPPNFQRQGAWLVEAHTACRGRWPRLTQLTGHNHLSSVLQIGSDRVGRGSAVRGNRDDGAGFMSTAFSALIANAVRPSLRFMISASSS